MAQNTQIQYIRFYTDGSAAKKIAPVTPFKTARLPKVNRKKKLVLRIDPVAVTGIIVAIAMMIMMAVGISQFVDAKQQVQLMEQHLETLHNNNEVLRNTYDSIDLTAIEQTALALGMVPESQVQHITLKVPQEQMVEEPTQWETFVTFLTGLFA